MKKFLILCLLAAVTACAPINSDCPREGGIGGTGGCPPSETLE